MEELLNDFNSENFTRREIIVYGIAYPVGLIAAYIIAEAAIWWPVFYTL